MVYRVLLPAAKNGLLAAVLLGVGRAVGETMAVLMATGHAVQHPPQRLRPGAHLTATIAAELGEAVGRVGDHYQVLFIIGILLFSITFVVNLTADLVVRGIRGKHVALSSPQPATRFAETDVAGASSRIEKSRAVLGGR